MIVAWFLVVGLGLWVWLRHTNNPKSERQKTKAKINNHQTHNQKPQTRKTNNPKPQKPKTIK